MLWPSEPVPIDAAEAIPPRRTDQLFAHSDNCQECHADQHASWHASFHRTMTQTASSETVVAPFDQTIEVDGQTFRLSTEADKFWVEMDDPEWEKATFEANGDTRAVEPDVASRPRTKSQVVMTTGSHHFQVYWTRSEYGRELWQFPLRYDIVEQQWVHRKDVFLGPPEWRPGMRFRVWNDDCILCHSVGGQPGLDRETGWMSNTTISELGVACESCHGPGEAHVQKHRAADATESTGKSDEPDPTIVNPAKLDHELSSEICGSCHSNFLHDDADLLVGGSQFKPGRRLTEVGRFFRPQLERDDDIVSRFWGDGVNRSTGREFMGMKDSPCYRQGEISCLSCHSMHNSDPNDQLAANMETNDACLQCHESIGEDVSAHTHHAADSSGSLCYNCHMPHTNYALFKATRSHTVTSPSVTAIEHKSRPNACNLCHLDQSLAWTAEHLEQWYEQPRPELAEDEQQLSAWALWALRGDAGQRVVAAWHPRWDDALAISGSEWLKPILQQLAQDPYAAVRYVAKATRQRIRDSSDENVEVAESAQKIDQEKIDELTSRRDDTPIASVE